MGGFGNNMFAALSDSKKGSKKGSLKSKSKKKDSTGTGNKRRDSEATNTSEDGDLPAVPLDWTAATSQLGSRNWADIDEDDELGKEPSCRHRSAAVIARAVFMCVCLRVV